MTVRRLKVNIRTRGKDVTKEHDFLLYLKKYRHEYIMYVRKGLKYPLTF